VVDDGIVNKIVWILEDGGMNNKALVSEDITAPRDPISDL